jgi:hypothetical protein
MVRNKVVGLEFKEAGGVITKYPKCPFEPLQLFGLAFGVEAGTALFITDAGWQGLEPFQKSAKMGLSTLPGQVLRALFRRAEAGSTASLPAETGPPAATPPLISDLGEPLTGLGIPIVEIRKLAS